ncbi:hypothetical protein ACFQL4_21840 [Halosimplex aquaticum]
MKLTNTHLHLLEAFATYYEVFETETGRCRLHELFDIVTNTVYRTGRRFCTDKYADWTPKLDDEAFRIVSYGHDLEECGWRWRPPTRWGCRRTCTANSSRRCGTTRWSTATTTNAAASTSTAGSTNPRASG